MKLPCRKVSFIKEFDMHRMRHFISTCGEDVTDSKIKCAAYIQQAHSTTKENLSIAFSFCAIELYTRIYIATLKAQRYLICSRSESSFQFLRSHCPQCSSACEIKLLLYSFVDTGRSMQCYLLVLKLDKTELFCKKTNRGWGPR